MQNGNKSILIQGFPFTSDFSELKDNCGWESRDFAETARPFMALYV